MFSIEFKQSRGCITETYFARDVIDMYILYKDGEKMAEYSVKVNAEDNTFVIGSANLVVYIRYDNVTSIEEWKGYLAKNELKITYPLATLTQETIDLPEILTFEDYTNIEVLTEIAPSKIEATYYGYTME